MNAPANIGKVARPLKVEPRGLRRPDAAAYIGVSTTLFDEMVGDGRMPPPKVVNTAKVWDRRLLDDAFDALPDKSAESDTWSDLDGGDSLAPR